jgi:hypothetical protein
MSKHNPNRTPWPSTPLTPWERPQGCEWFALCDRPATGFTPHPVLGSVPTCDRCATRAAQ